MRFFQSITTQQFTLRITVEFIPGEKRKRPAKPKPEPNASQNININIVNDIG